MLLSAFIQPTTSIYSESAAGSRFAKNISSGLHNFSVHLTVYHFSFVLSFALYLLSAFIQPTTSTYSESVAGSSFAGNISSGLRAGSAFF